MTFVTSANYDREGQHMRESLAELAIRGRVHPHTGEPIVPVGFRKSGSPIWPVMGASEDDPDDKEDPDDKDDPDKDDPDDPDDDDEDDDDDDEEAKRAAEAKRKANADAKRHRLENKKLRKQIEERDAKLKEFEDKDKDDLTKVSESAKELSERNEKLEQANAELALQNAFLASNSISWHDPKAALRLADLDDVEIDEDGEVTGLDDALKKLAKEKPYLVKSKDDDDEETPARRTSTGQPPRKNKSRATKDREKLTKKYPALRRG